MGRMHCCSFSAPALFVRTPCNELPATNSPCTHYCDYLVSAFTSNNAPLPSSDDEREHANILMAQQNRRGGKVVLAPISRPVRGVLTFNVP